MVLFGLFGLHVCLWIDGCFCIQFLCVCSSSFSLRLVLAHTSFTECHCKNLDLINKIITWNLFEFILHLTHIVSAAFWRQSVKFWVRFRIIYFRMNLFVYSWMKLASGCTFDTDTHTQWMTWFDPVCAFLWSS